MYKLLPLPIDANIILSIGDIAELSDFPIREFLDSRWVPKRAREFKAGRTLAREMLTNLGYNYDTITVDSDRVPVWPSDIIGSISHTDEKILIAISTSESCLCLGIDAEFEDSTPPELYSILFVTTEILLLKSGSVISTNVFCCKEAVYKAVFPRVREFFNFQDICIRITANSFSVQCLNTSLRSYSLITQGIGYTFKHEGLWIALFYVPRAPQ